MRKLFAFFFLLTAMVSQAAPKGGHPVLVPFPITEDPCAVQPEKTERVLGHVKWFNDDKGYGFLTQDEPMGYDVFVHFRALGTARKKLKEGEKVRFEVNQGQKGLQADNVEVIK